MEDEQLSPPSPIRNHFRDHRDCVWTCQGGERQRKYGGDLYPVLSFFDETCSFTESIPIDVSRQYVVISDSLREAMGWDRNKFLFAKAWFFRADTVLEFPDAGLYLVTFFHLNEYGACYFGTEAG